MDVETIAADQLTRVYQGLADFTVLQSLRLGFIPPSLFTAGVPRLTKWLPAIAGGSPRAECTQAGWQPVPAARVPEPLWSSRFGRDLGTLLVVAHETDQPVRAEVSVENARLGSGAFLFSRRTADGAHYDGRALKNQAIQGETRWQVEAPVRQPLLMRAQIAVSPASALREAEVSETLGISGATLTAELTGSGQATIRVRVPPDMKVKAATWKGAALALSAAQASEVEGRLRPAGKGTLTVQFVSTLFGLADEDLLNYPFVAEDRPACTIVIPAQATEREQHLGRRLQEYFRYWHATAAQPRATIVIPIQPAGSALSGPQIILRAGSGPARVSRDGDNLVFQAPDDAALESVLFQVLRALDRKYFTAGTLPATVLHQRLGLAGKTIE